MQIEINSIITLLIFVFNLHLDIFPPLMLPDIFVFSLRAIATGSATIYANELRLTSIFEEFRVLNGLQFMPKLSFIIYIPTGT